MGDKRKSEPRFSKTELQLFQDLGVAIFILIVLVLVFVAVLRYRPQSVEFTCTFIEATLHCRGDKLQVDPVAVEWKQGS